MQSNPKVNGSITADTVILISLDGSNHGKVKKAFAIATAKEKGLDLIQMSYPTNGEPPVCKIMDYGKYQYKRSKKIKNKTEVVKEIRVSYRIAEHDLAIKNKNLAVSS